LRRNFRFSISESIFMAAHNLYCKGTRESPRPLQAQMAQRLAFSAFNCTAIAELL
jgi:hypothetical protein